MFKNITILCWLSLLIAYSGAASSDATVWIPGWRDTEPLGTPRAGAAVARAGDYVYAIGGIDGKRFLKTVEFAHLLPDGRLEPWQLTAPMNEERGFFAAVVRGEYVYVAGGGNGDSGKNLLRTVERAPIRRDGRLGTWERLEVTLNYARRCVKLAIAGDSLYALGGFGGVLLDSTERAPFLPDGRLGPFAVEEHAFSLPRYIHAEAATDHAVYVIGGHNEREGTGIRDVEYASMGKALVWHPTAALLHPRYALSAATLGDRLYALGGLDGPVYLDGIEVSRVAPDGALSPWRATTPLPSPRANFGSFEYHGYVYVIGGTNRDGYFRTVEYAGQNDEGDLGFRGSAAEADAYARTQAARSQSIQTPLPNKGVVLEVIQTDVYSYLRVEGPEGKQWLAAPRGDYHVKDRIGYSRGTPMADFYSRALKRSFDSILFVERIESLR